jgi:anaerobic selenocysteine-containing dehydrogenase
MGARVIEPHGETRSNHEVVCALAKRLGAEHPGFDMTAMEMIDETLKKSGHPDAATLKEKRWVDCMPDFETAHHLNGFGWPDKKFRFKPDWKSMGPGGAAMPEFPDYMAVIDAPDAEHPFRMVTAPAHNYLNSSFTETRTSQAKETRPSALLHPGDARDLGLAEGDRVRLGNSLGSIVLHARIANGANGNQVGTTHGQQRGTVIVESIWPNTAFEEGIGINTLTSAEPGYPNGGAVFHDTAVWVRGAN